MSLHGDLILYPPGFMTLATRFCDFARCPAAACAVSCDLRLPPACSICRYCLSVLVYGRKPASAEDSLNHPEEPPTEK